MGRPYEIIVVGAGPAGSAAAALFARQGRRVLLLDKARFPRPKPCAEYLSPGAVDVLQRLGALEPIEKSGQRRWLRGMQVVAPNGDRHLVQYADAAGEPRRSLSMARPVLDMLLLEVARASGAEVREGCRVSAAWQEDGRVRGVVGPGGERMQADLVVGADGLRSVVAGSLGLQRTLGWPRRLGLVAHYADVDWPEECGQMLVGKRGYVGAAPLDGNGLVTVGLVCHLPRGRLGSAAAALEAGLADCPELARRLRGGRRVSNVTGIGPMARAARRLVGPGFALLGDAAGFFDPFTGEVIFRALRGAELLAADPLRYAPKHKHAFRARERLVAVVQLLVQSPPLMNFAVGRLRARNGVAHELDNMLGDLQPARLGVVWRLLGP